MRAKTHPGDERRVESTASDKTMDVEKGSRDSLREREKAGKELEKIDLTVDEVAAQSSYEDDQMDVAHQAANSDRDKNADQ